ncbi:TPA: hypothetical protein ACJ2O0_005382, partial [Klebsiella pneumoniae]
VVGRMRDLILQLSKSSIYSTKPLPTPSPDLMSPPCKASDAAKDSDEDLQADIESTQCLRQLRLDKYRWQAYYKAIAR